MGDNSFLAIRLLYALAAVFGFKIALGLVHIEKGCTDAVIRNPEAANIAIGTDGLPHGGNIDCRKTFVIAKAVQHIGQ